MSMLPLGKRDPNGLFGFIPPTTAPMEDVSGGGPATPPPAFVYGAGGSRMTPDMIASRSKMAQGLIAAGMDTSPVASWTQGAARVAQALVGNMQQNRLDKASDANAVDSRAALASLGSGDAQSIASILGSDYINDGVKDAAKLQWQATHRAPVQPTEFERSVVAGGYTPGTPGYIDLMRRYAINKADPLQGVPGIDPATGDSIIRFVRPSTMGGGGPASVAPAGGAAPPATLPPDFDFGGPTQPASAGFR